MKYSLGRILWLLCSLCSNKIFIYSKKPMTNRVKYSIKSHVTNCIHDEVGWHENPIASTLYSLGKNINSQFWDGSSRRLILLTRGSYRRLMPHISMILGEPLSVSSIKLKILSHLIIAPGSTKIISALMTNSYPPPVGSCGSRLAFNSKPGVFSQMKI